MSATLSVPPPTRQPGRSSKAWRLRALLGLAVAVANAHPWVAEHAHVRTRLSGGYGAAREVADLILAAQGKAEAERDRWL